MLSVANKSFMLNVIILSAFILSVVAQLRWPMFMIVAHKMTYKIFSLLVSVAAASIEP
jgi:hypothetical protein